MFTVYVKTVDFNPWVQKIARLGPVLVLGGRGNSPKHWNLNRELFLVRTSYFSISERLYEYQTSKHYILQFILAHLHIQ